MHEMSSYYLNGVQKIEKKLVTNLLFFLQMHQLKEKGREEKAKIPQIDKKPTNQKDNNVKAKLGRNSHHF